MEEKIIPVILAGGSGFRLWPLSRQERPKQFFDPDGNGSLLLRTLKRAQAIAQNALPVIVTAKITAEVVEKELFAENGKYELLTEPFSAGTTAAIALVAAVLQNRGEKGTLVIMPADHYIPDTELFCRDVTQAITVSGRKNAITVLGIKPRYPATGFGYAEAEKIEKINEIHYCKVKRFVEKPHREKARRYLKKGTYYWNSGITVCPSAIMDGILTENYDAYHTLRDLTAEDTEGLTLCYQKAENISFDCSVLEREKNIYLIKAEFPWHDVGTFQNLAAMIPQDVHDNVLRGNIVLKEVGSSVIVSDMPLTAVMGVRDLTVIAENGVLLVCPRRKGEEVKDIVNALSGDNEKFK